MLAHHQIHHASTRSHLSCSSSSSSSSSSESLTLAITPPIHTGKLNPPHLAKLDLARPKPTIPLPAPVPSHGKGPIGPHHSNLPRRRRGNAVQAYQSARTRPSTRRSGHKAVDLGHGVALSFADSDVEDGEVGVGWDVVLRVVLHEDERELEEQREKGEKGEEKVLRLPVPDCTVDCDEGVMKLTDAQVRRGWEAVRCVLERHSKEGEEEGESKTPKILILAPPTLPTDSLSLALCIMSSPYSASSPSHRPLLPTFLPSIQDLLSASSPSEEQEQLPPHAYGLASALNMHIHDSLFFPDSVGDVEEKDIGRWRGSVSPEGMERVQGVVDGICSALY